jgi:hypothetical protein
MSMHVLRPGRRAAAAVLAVALTLVAATASAQAPSPTIALDRGCYAEEEQMRLTGAGYTPDGPVDVILATTGPRGGYTTHADAAGALDDVVSVASADLLLAPDEERETIFVSANDRTRIDSDQQPPESQFGSTQFTFTRWQGFSPGRFVPGRRATVELYGWTFATGKIGWFLFRQRSRTVAAVKVGRLDDACGDRTARIKVPRRLKPGAYRVVLTTDRALRGPYTWRKARVTARRSVASAASPGTPTPTTWLRQRHPGRSTEVHHVPSARVAARALSRAGAGGIRRHLARRSPGHGRSGLAGSQRPHLAHPARPC